MSSQLTCGIEQALLISPSDSLNASLSAELVWLPASTYQLINNHQIENIQLATLLLVS